ncbi:HAMP domain-containing protein [Sulfurimonas aquatica]|uniref:histidine kinase n=1 Tax=Sulfurimonas aquatica TaxID=2672570 RepID=A0A975AYK5_9BACT|nr:ATP-binding protein [Sulfurimonas aquatica]QSZ40977.1 HAMP domain-containing protein [Sulfurimonas aquatica]
MFHFLQKSLKNRLLFSFISISVLPFLALLSYTLFLGENKMLDKIITEQINQTEVVVKRIEAHLKSMQKEINFLSSLEIMDDILAEDIDKRISNLLSKKVADYDLDIEMLVVDKSANIVSSSNIMSLSQRFHQLPLKNESGFSIVDKYLYIYSSIYSSFNKRKTLGHLVLKYNLLNLHKYLHKQEGIHSYLINPNSSFSVGDDAHLKFSIQKDIESVITDEHVIVYKKISSFLESFYLVYGVNKDIALGMLYDFTRFILYTSALILLIIIIVSIRYAKEIVKPIQQLTKVTDTITKEHNYATKLTINTQDEIATLADSFNKMLETTSDALKTLETENRVRLQRFIQLIEIFNTIIQTQDEQECIETSIQEIQKLTNKNDLYFHKNKDQNSIDIYVTNFEKDIKEYFGSISLIVKNIDDENERNFYASIVSMITLQLERIRLINTTTAVSKAKSAFISNMSHELRTPLNAIIGFSQNLISYEELTENQQDSVASIESSAEYLLSMINEILDIAKIEAGKMETHIKDVDILELVQNCYDMLRPLADDKEIAFELISDKLGEKRIQTDSKMFQQIILNLLSNAIKFTSSGYVKLSVYNKNSSLYIVVEDSGIGLSQDDISKLFSDFTQVQNIMQKKHKGSGLGLSLSKKMANLLDGDIQLTSDGLKKGSTAIFSLKI